MGLAANQILTDKGITIQRSNKGKLAHLVWNLSKTFSLFCIVMAPQFMQPVEKEEEGKNQPL